MNPEPVGGKILIASNRGPVSFTRGADGNLTRHRGAGGLVSGLSTVAGQAEVLWVCAALSDADRAAAKAAPEGRIDSDSGASGSGASGSSDSGSSDSRGGGPSDGSPSDGGPSDGGPAGGDGSGAHSAVRMLDIPATTFHRAYNSVANSTLWFVHHMLYDTPNRPNFGLAFRREWESFRGYNATFATALAEGAGDPGGGVRAMVQDYHLTLAPKMLADLRPDIRIGHFSHTPWAPPDYFRLLPDSVGREVLEGILGAHHAGFLAQRWADAFLDCCREFLGADVDTVAKTVTHRGRVTSVGVHALGVDAGSLRQRGAAADVQAQVEALSMACGDRKLIVRVDRTELSKNIVRGLLAYRELLITHPEWRGRVTHIALAYPSRHDLPEYREYTASVQRLASQIEDEFSTEDWDPLLLAVNDDYPRSLAAYRLADVLLVNPIRDGMNLVAKEGPILSERDCALVLSTEAGAAAELGAHALLVNPFDVSATAQALHEALTMPDPQRKTRSAALVKAGGALPPSAWFQAQLDGLDQARPPGRGPAPSRRGSRLAAIRRLAGR